MALTYETASPGQRELGCVLVVLPPHHLDEGKKGHLNALLEQLGGWPEAVLFSVAGEVRDLVDQGQLRQRPRYAQLKEMMDAALVMHIEIEALIMTRAEMRAKVRAKMMDLPSVRRKLIQRPTRRRICRPTR